MELRARAGEQARRLLRRLRQLARRRLQRQELRLRPAHGVDPLELLARRELHPRPLQLHPLAWAVEAGPLPLRLRLQAC
jgi:hypothetical protein